MKSIVMTVILMAACAGSLFAEGVEDILQALNTVGPATSQPPAAVTVAPSTSPAVAVSKAEAPVSTDAAPAEAAAEAAPAEKTDEISMSEKAASGSDMQDGRISLSLKGVTLQEVVRLFSELSNANIIVPDLAPAAAGAPEPRIDVNLSNVEWKAGLQAILETQGMELYEKIPGSEVYGVRTKIPDAPEPMEVRVFKLNYATVASVTNMISGLVGEGGDVSTFPARNVIVVKSSAKLLSDLEGIIERIDLPREQVFIEAKFLELSDSASDQLGIDWQALGGYGVSAGPLSQNYSKTKTDAQTTGFDPGSDLSAPEIYTTPAGDGLFQQVISDPFKQTLESSTLTAVLGADEFNLTLSALKQINGVKVVSNPKVIVANEETATIHIGQKKPNVRGTTTTAGETQTITTYSLDGSEPYFMDGIKVDVTPTVNTEQSINVKIQPTLERLDTIPIAAPDGTLFYGKKTKTINTVFGLQSGQTAAIGGLTEVSDSDLDRKIPVLGSIPLIGRLFSYQSKNKQQTETIIFVTVGLANPDGINMETGLPEDASLARRYQLSSHTDRAIDREKLKVLEAKEQERLEEIVGVVRAEEEKRQLKK